MGPDLQHREVLDCPESCNAQLQGCNAPASFEVRCLCLHVSEAPGTCRHSHTFAGSLLTRVLCGFPINTSQGGLVNMDEAF